MMITIKRFWALCLDTHMKLALYKYAIIIIICIYKKRMWTWYGTCIFLLNKFCLSLSLSLFLEFITRLLLCNTMLYSHQEAR